MLVTAQDFKVKPYKIPNLDDPETLADFVSIATREEEDVLNRILGPNLYSDVLAGLEEDPVLAIYTNLVSGVEYEYVNRKYKFIGLKAILKPWIFAQWIRNNYREFTGAGVAIPALENAQILNPGQMIYDAESDFVNLVGGKASFSSSPSLSLLLLR
jgi:hypothetical protein